MPGQTFMKCKLHQRRSSLETLKMTIQTPKLAQPSIPKELLCEPRDDNLKLPS